MSSNLLADLLKRNVFQVGEFTLKSGQISPIYIDLRSIISHPDLVGDIAKEVFSLQKKLSIEAEVVCGVPYTALPIASIYSFLNKVPLVLKRKEAKGYGTNKMVEGVSKKGVSCLIIEDIVTSGSSVIETADILRQEGLVVTDCIVIVNRMQGGTENIAKAGIKLHSLFTIHDIFEHYCSVNKIDSLLVENVREYLQTNSFIPIKKSAPKKLPFSVRVTQCKQPVAKHLFEIMVKKETNLCVAVDVTSSKDLLQLAETLGPHICMLKTHIDILTDFSNDLVKQLTDTARKHNFLVFEDRKFADIGNTVKLQYKEGAFNILDWADIVTVHSLPGSGILDGFLVASQGKERACVLIAEMSSVDALIDSTYVKKTVEMAEDYDCFVIGFVSQSTVSENPNFIHMSPGVSTSAVGDCLGQQYNSPEHVVSNGADIIIVGRGICNSANVEESAIEYKNRGFNAYLSNCHVA